MVIIKKLKQRLSPSPDNLSLPHWVDGYFILNLRNYLNQN